MASHPDQDRWFCNDVEGEGVTWHATKEAAFAHAATCIAKWPDEARDWPDEAHCLLIGSAPLKYAI